MFNHRRYGALRLKFLDRDNEKTRLEKTLKLREGSFCCLYGRRRCGKSRLLQEILRRQRAVYYVSDERDHALQRASLASAIAGILPGFDQVEYPDWNSLLERWWKDAPTGTVMALDEFPYLVKASPELPSILQRLIDKNKKRGIHLVVSGSSQRMMQGLVLDASAPLYGRAQQIIDVEPLGAAWIGKALKLSRPFDYLQAYSFWGGVPRYWELAADYPSSWSAVRELVLDPLGVLHNEPRQLLLDDLRETAQAASLLSLIGRGCNRISEIAVRLEKPATSLTRPLHRLLDMGFIRREHPFLAVQRNSKKTFYRINDPFLGFWFRYVEPNRSRLESGQLRAVARDIERDIQVYYGEIWEVLVRRSVARLDIDGIEWLPANRWWGAGIDRKPMEIDVVSKSSDGKALLVGEVKIALGPNKLERAEKKLEEKIERLPFAKTYERIIRKIFVVEVKNMRALSTALISAKEVFRVLK